MIRDFYTHLDETLNISVKLLDAVNQPITFANTSIRFAVSMELDTVTIDTLTSANTAEIIVTDANNALIDVYFKPTIAGGFEHGTHVYQLIVDKPTGSTMYLEGRIFIQPSLFD